MSIPCRDLCIAPIAVIRCISLGTTQGTREPIREPITERTSNAELTQNLVIGCVQATITPQILHRIVKEKPPEPPRSTAKFTHVVTDYGLTCGQTQKNGLVPTSIREGTSPSYLPRKRKLSRAFAGKQKKNGNRTIPVFLLFSRKSS